MKKILLALIAPAAFACSAFASDVPSEFKDSFSSELANIQAVLSQSAKDFHSTYLSYDDLAKLLAGKDPAVRKAALGIARDRIGQHDVYVIVIRMAKNTSELPDIRLKATRILHGASGIYEVQEALKDLGKNDKDINIRAMAYKALYPALASNDTLRHYLMDILQDEKVPDVRLAIIWSFFNACQYNDVKDKLQQILREGKDTQERIEAVKSLYQAVRLYAVRVDIVNVAKNPAEPKELRIPAIMALYRAKEMWEAYDALNKLSQDSDSDIHVAALKGEYGDPQDMQIYFHLSYRLANGGIVGPLDEE